jgi:small subunit ribosomal protein S15
MMNLSVANIHHSSFIIHHFQEMAVYYSKEKVAEIITQYGGDAKNSGNTEAQVALLTYRIESLSAHLRINPKDHSTRRALLTMVGQRKSLLSYYAKKDIYKYRALIEKLGLRK